MTNSLSLGIDAGLSTAGSFVMGMGAKSAADKVGDVAKTAAGATVAGVVDAAGFADGLMRGKKNNEDANLNKTDNEKNTDETNDDLPPEDKQEDSNLEKESKDTETKNASENEGEDSETGEPDMEEKNSESHNDDSTSSDETGETANEQDSSKFSEETGEKNTTSDHESTESVSKNSSDTSDSTAPDEKERRNSDRSSVSEREGNTANSLEKVENPFKKKAKDMIHTNKYQKNMKNPIGNQVDRYQRNKEFGQEVNEWLNQRKALKEQARNEQRQKNND